MPRAIFKTSRSLRISSSKKVCKGVRGMPRLMEATKDVYSCEKLRGSAKETRSGDIRMGQPGGLKGRHSM